METVLLLHGAIGAADQLAGLAQALEQHHHVITLDFSGHGGRSMPDGDFAMDLFAAEVLQLLEERNLPQVTIFGYSMGGYVGLYLAKHHPEKVKKVITLATKFQWDDAIAAKETQMLNPEKIEQKLPAFAKSLSDRHAPNDWKTVLQRTATMMVNLGKDNPLKIADYSTVSTPSLILLGDRDKMVGLDETLEVYRALPNARFGVLPNTPHPIEQAPVALLAFLVNDFVTA